MSEKIAFQEEREVKKTRELKLGGQSSRFQSKIIETERKEKATEEFEKKADQLVSNRKEQGIKFNEAVNNLLGALRDKTLKKNKGVALIELEKNIIKDMQGLILDIDNDPEQKYDCMGSNASIYLLFKIIFEQRDRINELEFKISEILSRK